MQKQFILDTRIAPADVIEVKPGAEVTWPDINGCELAGKVEKHFGARLWYVKQDNGTEHVVGSWILRPRWFVLLDARDNRRGVQVYDKAAATQMAEQLNNYVHQNSGLGSLFPTAKVTGPFYPVPATENECKPYLLREHA